MVQRVLLGKFPDGHFGLRISAPGYDVRSNPPVDDSMYFNSDWPELFPIYVRGSFGAANNVDTTISYPALGYVPFIVGAYTTDNVNFHDFGSLPNSAAGNTGPVWTWSDNSGFARMQAFSDHLKFQCNQGNVTAFYSVLTTRAV